MSPRRALLLLGAGAVSCLPNDTRSPPGSVLVTVSSDGVAATGISASETTDGWSISFDRVLVALGYASLDGDSCDVYSDAGYGRIFDLKAQGAQKVSILYALGRCDFGFRVAAPNADSLLGAGVAEADKVMMRTPASDAFTQASGVAIYVRGHATQGGVTKSFEWPFRYRARYLDCSAGADGGVVRGLTFRARVAETLNLSLSPAPLFGDDFDLSRARPRFQVFADADSITGNDDGVVTLEELARVPLKQAGFRGAGVPPDGGALEGGAYPIDAAFIHRADRGPDENTLPTLADYVYLVLFPAMVRYEGDGTCSVALTDRGVGS